jgi:hypothetical protein
MEFENNSPVSDEDRRLAEAKKLTLQPIHTDVIPDEISDSEIATAHIIAPTLGNASNDTEDATTRVMPTKSLLGSQSQTKPQAYKLMIGIIGGIVIFTGLAIIAVVK